MKATGIVRRIDDLGRFTMLALSKRWGRMVHNNEKLRPCPMLENPELLPKMVVQSGAHSTDPEAPESGEHLCEKCKAYTACWKPEAEKLWAEEKHNG